MKPGPCYKCEKREPGCHGKCAEYQEWAKASAAENQATRAKKIERMKQYPAAAGSKTHKKLHSEV